MKEKIMCLIAGSTVVVLFSFLLDLFDIPSQIGLRMAAINWDAMSLIVGNILVILIAVITYLLIDKRNREKDENQRKCALLFIEQTYDECESMIELINTPTALEHAVKKCDFNKPIYEDKALTHFLEFPFKYQDEITNFASEGVITKEEFSDYSTLKEAYRNCLHLEIMFFDRSELYKPARIEFDNTLKKVRHSLKEAE